MKIFYYYDKRGEKVNRPPGYCKLRGKHKIKPHLVRVGLVGMSCV